MIEILKKKYQKILGSTICNLYIQYGSTNDSHLSQHVVPKQNWGNF